MKIKLRLLALALIAGGTMFAETRVSIGFSVGGYGPGAYAPPVYAQYQPPCPGPGYTWVDGYWTPQYGRRVWIQGFWRAPVVRVMPRYVAPRYVGPRYVEPRHYEVYRGKRGGERHDERNDKHGKGYSNGFRR